MSVSLSLIVLALLAAGGTITAVDAVLDGRVENAYALVRPPGHHAEADIGRGSHQDEVIRRVERLVLTSP